MSKYLPYILTMAIVTYLIRMIPLTFFQKELKSPFIKSFLFYVPYAVLGAMTFPAIFTASQNLIPSLAGTIVALILAYKEKWVANGCDRCLYCRIYHGINPIKKGVNQLLLAIDSFKICFNFIYIFN